MKKSFLRRRWRACWSSQEVCPLSSQDLVSVLTHYYSAQRKGLCNRAFNSSGFGHKPDVRMQHLDAWCETLDRNEPCNSRVLIKATRRKRARGCPFVFHVGAHLSFYIEKKSELLRSHQVQLVCFCMFFYDIDVTIKINPIPCMHFGWWQAGFNPHNHDYIRNSSIIRMCPYNQTAGHNGRLRGRKGRVTVK